MHAPDPHFTTTHWSVVLSARDAEDLVHGSFARLPGKDWLRAAGPEPGRFRTFLSVAFRRYMADEHDYATRQKRGGGAAMIPLDVMDAESFYATELSTMETPEHAFDKSLGAWGRRRRQGTFAP